MIIVNFVRTLRPTYIPPSRHTLAAYLLLAEEAHVTLPDVLSGKIRRLDVYQTKTLFFSLASGKSRLNCHLPGKSFGEQLPPTLPRCEVVWSVALLLIGMLCPVP